MDASRQHSGGSTTKTMTAIKEQAALASVAASAGLAITKLIAAMITGSLGILSEAIHSLLDVGATVMTYFAVRVSDMPADAEHHYGHSKVESIAALFETGLLFVASGWICYEAVHRLLAGDAAVEVHPFAVAVIVVSIVVDFNRARGLARIAAATSSQALEADALHFSSDMWSSAVVLGGLGVVWLGFPRADAVAAIVVAVFVCIAGWRLGKRTVDTLLDAAPEGSADRIHDIAERVAGVVAIERLRVRPAGSVLFVDLEIAVSRTRSFEDIATTEAAVVAAIQTAMPTADVSVVVHPRALDDETVHDRVMVIARNRALAVHHLTVQQVVGPGGSARLAVSLDVEVDGRMTLEDAHLIATGLEDAIGAELGSDVEVETHIEPLMIDRLDGADLDRMATESIKNTLDRAASARGDVDEIHSVRARRTAEGVIVNFHCRVAPTMSVADMHVAIDDIERAVRSERPDIRRAIGHAEPRGVPHP